MLDSDLAKLYQCANGVKTINLAVKRHMNRFSKDFYFQLTLEEALDCSKSQVGTLNRNSNRCLNIKNLPHVFAEYGIIMLFGLVKSSHYFKRRGRFLA